MKSLSKPQKILAVMYELADGEQRSLQYEDIVVAAYRRYREDFQLRGYPEYPDSSDIHKPLYKMKREGLVRSANKMFELTPRGLEVAGSLIHGDSQAKDRLTKPEEREIARIVASAAFMLFQSGKQDRILDTDFYAFFGVSVRTSPNEFRGRLATVEHAIKAHKAKRNDDESKTLLQLHDFLASKFRSEINTLTST